MVVLGDKKFCSSSCSDFVESKASRQRAEGEGNLVRCRERAQSRAAKDESKLSENADRRVRDRIKRPWNYDGPIPTTRHISQVLPRVLRDIGKQYQDRPDLVLAAWPDVIGQKLAPMTQAVSFSDGFLVVKVNNSTLYSLLTQNDKPRLIKNLRDKFPQTMIKSIVFQLG